MNNVISQGLPPVVLIAGPTASGKSALAMRLAEMANGVVINADASQVYADLRILSARPSIEEESRAPHRLFGYLDASVACSAADWAAAARDAIAATHAEGRLPILVGGTGLYIRTLLDGIAPVSAIMADVREAVRRMLVEEAYAALSRADPEAATRLHPSDASRVARALEVVLSTGRTLASWQREKSGGIGESIRLAPLILLPPRDWLHQRINMRFETMMGTGGLEEAERLLARNLDANLPATRAIGVPAAADYLRGAIDRNTMIARGQAATRQYAKRQFTWFSHQPPTSWHRMLAQPDDSTLSLYATKLQQLALT